MFFTLVEWREIAVCSPNYKNYKSFLCANIFLRLKTSSFCMKGSIHKLSREGSYDWDKKRTKVISII